MQPSLASEDVAAMLEEVERFAARDVRPAVARPECPLDAEGLREIAGRAERAGLLNPAPEPAVGIWDDPESVAGRRLSVETLERIAAVNAGVAYHFHLRALGRRCQRRLELELADVALSLQGSHGLGDRALARCLRQAPLDDDDRDTLADYFTPRDGAALVLHAAPGWQHLLAPAFDAGQGRQGLVWHVVERGALRLVEEPPSHGLDELATWSIEPPAPGTAVVASGELARTLLAEALLLDALGLIGIALGAVRQARRMAVEYAGVRRQGGGLIAEHDAVRLLLARGASAIDQVELVLRALVEERLDAANLGRVCSVRAGVHPLLCRAANDALQVFGGLGYMQDTGLEKIVRDVNHLRRLRGAPAELALFAAEWEAHR